MANFLADDPQQDAPAAGGMASLFPPLPQHETHSTSESGSSTPVAAPEYTAAVGDVGKIATEQADTTEAQGQSNVDVAEAMKQEAADQLAALDKAAAEKRAESDRQNVNIKAQADVLRQANQALKEAPAPALFHEGDGWKNVAKAVALAVAAFGDALSAKGAALGGRSSSQNSVSNIVNMTLEQEREKIKKLSDNQLMAKTGLKDAIDARATALAEVDARGAEAMRRAQMLGEFMVKSAGPQAATYEARLKALGLQQEAAKFQAQSLQSLHKTITGKHSTENIDRDQTAKPPSANAIPTHFESGGENFTVNPEETTRQLHGQSRNTIPLIQGAIKNADKLINSLPDDKAPQWAFTAYISHDTARKEANAIAASLRNQASSALQESMGKEAAEERAKDLFPSVPQTDAGMVGWKAQIKAGRATMGDLLDERLHAAGAHHVGKAATEAPIPSQVSPTAAPPAAPGGKPSIDDLVKRAGGR